MADGQRRQQGANSFCWSNARRSGGTVFFATRAASTGPGGRGKVVSSVSLRRAPFVP